LAKGLFRQAIGESGGLFEPLSLAPDFTLPGAEQDGQGFMARAGAASIKALRSVPASELMKAHFHPNPIIDGYVLTQSPYDAYRHGEQNDVSILIGSNLDEGEYFIGHQKITVQNFTQELDDDFPSFIVSLAGPKPGATDQDAQAAAVAFEGDMRFRWDMWSWARLAADHGRSKVFLYEFTRAPPFPPGSAYADLGAMHGMEMRYVFDHLDQQAVPWTPVDRRLASVMSGYWTNFAKSGGPNGGSLPSWPAFTSAAPIAMTLGEAIEPKPVRDTEALKRIGRLYTAASFIQRNIYLLLGAVVLILAVLIAAIVTFVRRRRRGRLASA
jgi:para-nitrobenzyl esterase